MKTLPNKYGECAVVIPAGNCNARIKGWGYSQHRLWLIEEARRVIEGDIRFKGWQS